MRTNQVYPTEQIAHLWAHQKQGSARNPGGNLRRNANRNYTIRRK